MRSLKLSLVLLAALSGAAVFPGSWSFAAGEAQGDLSDIRARLTAIEEQQKEILAKEDKILAELDRIRIWVHRK